MLFWNTIALDTAFYKPTDGRFDRSIVGRESKFTYIVIIESVKWSLIKVI
jgi:hypothetical protein